MSQKSWSGICRSGWLSDVIPFFPPFTSLASNSLIQCAPSIIHIRACLTLLHHRYCRHLPHTLKPPNYPPSSPRFPTSPPSPSLISSLTFTSTLSHLPSPPSPAPARTPSPASPSLTLAHVHTVIISTCTLTPAFSNPFPQVHILSLFYPQSPILLSSSPATLKSGHILTAELWCESYLSTFYELRSLYLVKHLLKR